MSVAPVQCPSSSVLEEIALGRATPPELREHLANCAACRQALQQIRDDNNFLSSFAINGALPPIPTAGASPQFEIPGYELSREVHRGGQGVVYQAVQRSTKRDVAVKVMKQGPFATLADRARFVREIETLSKLDHPNIVAVHDAGMSAGFHYFVMDFIDGPQLDEWITMPPGAARDAASERNNQDEPSPWPRNSKSRLASALGVFIKVCDAVHAAHLRGVMHRDLKPSNIRIDRQGQPYVLDFGLAKSTTDAADSAMTRTGQFVGSLPWASPEQVQGESAKIDLRTDVYSLGAILYQLLTGRLPLDVGSNLRDAVDNILRRQPPRPSSISSTAGGPRIDDELDTIVLKCLSKDRDRRYQSAGELARDLRRYLANEPIEAKRDSALYVLRKTLGRYRRRVAAAGAFVVLMGVFSVVMAILYQRSARLEREAVRSAASLADLLSQSNVEQGRMAGLLGNLEQAEHLLWHELLTHREADENSAIRGNSPPGPPEAYWALWQLYRRQPCLRTLTPQPIATRTATLAADGASLWTVDQPGFVQKLDEFGATLDSYRVVLPNAHGLSQVDPFGQTILNYDGARYGLWRRDHGEKPLFEPPPQTTGGWNLICTSPSGNRLAALIDGTVVVWNTHPFAEVARLAGSEPGIVALAISNNDRQLAVRNRGGDLLIWEIEPARLVAETRVPTSKRDRGHPLGELIFSADDRLLADAWGEISGRIWNLSANPPTFIDLAERPGDYRVQSFSPDGRLLAIGDLGGSLRVFDTQTGQRLARLVAHAGRIRSVAFAGDGRSVWTCGEGDLRLWEVAVDAGVHSIRIDDDSFHTVDISPDGRWLVAGGGSGLLRRIDSATTSATSVSFGNSAPVSSVAISPDAGWIAAATYANAAYIWQTDQLDRPPLRLAHPHRVSHVCFSPDGLRLATACDDGAVRLWRVADGALERELRSCIDRVPQIAFDADGRRLAAVCRDGSLQIWNLAADPAAAPETLVAATQSPIRAVRFSHDGRWLAAAGADRDIHVWDAANWRRVAALVGHNQEVYCLDISASGELIASGDAAGVIRLWHLGLRRPLATFEGHTAPVMALRFAPDGRSLVSASVDGSLRQWDLTYYEQHIAGQVDVQLRRTGLDAGDPPRARAWREWAMRVLRGEATAKGR